MGCNVHTCGACAHSLAGHDTDAELVQLENMCYAAKQCAVERCAGTLVNMRKPLCNLGNYLTSELHSTRVLLQALWIIITDKISSQVELTHQRREVFQIKWPAKAVQQTTCTAKDSIISMAATMTCDDAPSRRQELLAQALQRSASRLDVGTTTMVEQRATEAEQLADRIAILHKGRIVVNGTLAELRQLLPPARVEYVEKQPTLEDVFLALVGNDDAGNPHANN